MEKAMEKASYSNVQQMMKVEKEMVAAKTLMDGDHARGSPYDDAGGWYGYDDGSQGMHPGGPTAITGMPASTNLNGTQVTLKEFDQRKNAWVCVFPSGKERVVGLNNLQPLGMSLSHRRGGGDERVPPGERG